MFDNINILCDIVKSCDGKIVGRKRMHKIFFILQEGGFLPGKYYKFRWNYYGVYSDELASDISVGEFFDLLRETEEVEGSYKTYVIECSNNDDYYTDIVRNPRYLKAVELINRQETRVMEVLSSIMYFEKQGLSKAEIEKRLDIFKGHLKPFFADAFRINDELKKIA